MCKLSTWMKSSQQASAEASAPVAARVPLQVSSHRNQERDESCHRRIGTRESLQIWPACIAQVLSGHGCDHMTFEQCSIKFSWLCNVRAGRPYIPALRQGIMPDAQSFRESPVFGKAMIDDTDDRDEDN
nr:hypothetical protein CFP56_09414 [Quercus suber]